MKTNWQDPGSAEILSAHISGLQEAVGKIEDSIGLQTTAETAIPLDETFIEVTDRYRIYQASVGKRNWIASPAPVIKKNGVTISSGFAVEYGGGAIVLDMAALSTDTFTADFTRTNDTSAFTNHTADISSQTDGGHVKRSGTIITGSYANAEGSNTKAMGNSSHAEGDSTVANSDYSHAEGLYTLACYGTIHKITAYDDALKTITLDNVTALVVGNLLQIKINDERAIGDIPVLAINGLVVTLDTALTITYNWKYAVEKIGGTIEPAHAEGRNALASGRYSHAEGYSSIASGESSHVEGAVNIAAEYATHAEGSGNLASGYCSHAEGQFTTASGLYSHSAGYYTQAKYAQTVIGRYGTISAASDTNYVATNEVFTIGNGTGVGTRGLAFKVLFDGNTYADAAYNSTGADYAEYFEWLDENLNSEDRVGYFVTLEENKIKKATSIDYILGVVSATPSIIGDNQDDHWQGKYLTDEWGRVQYHEVVVPAVTDEENNIIVPEHTDIVPIYNPEWDSTLEYIPREKRPEWSAIGIIGKLLVRDNGTCQVNGYCKSNDEGIATTSSTGYRVIKRISANIVQVFLK